MVLILWFFGANGKLRHRCYDYRRSNAANLSVSCLYVPVNDLFALLTCYKGQTVFKCYSFNGLARFLINARHTSKCFFQLS